MSLKDHLPIMMIMTRNTSEKMDTVTAMQVTRAFLLVKLLRLR